MYALPLHTAPGTLILDGNQAIRQSDMDLFGLGQRAPARKSSGRQADVRAKKRRPTRDRSSLGQQSNDIGSGERSVHDWLGTVVEGPENENVARMKESPIVKEDVPGLESAQTRGTDEILNRIDAVERRMEQSFDKFDKFVCQVERRVEEDGVVVSAQKDVIEQWKREAGALVTTLKRVVGSSSIPVVSATVGAVKKDVENLGSVQAASNLKTDRSGELKPREKATSELAMLPKTEKMRRAAAKVEEVEKKQEAEDVDGSVVATAEA